MRYRQIRTFAGKGSRATEFRQELHGIHVDKQGRLYVAGDAEIKVFDATGLLVRRWNTAIPPFAVAVAADGSVWAGQTGQVEIFDPTGNRIRTWGDIEHMGCVTSIGFFTDSILIGDSRKRCLFRFDAAGKYRNAIGNDNPLGGLHIPNGIVDFGIDPQGVVHVANPGRHRVERYSMEGKLLGHMGKFTGSDPTGFSGCCNPTNVAIIGPDRLCVTEKAGPRAKIYDYSGKLLTMIESPDFDPRTKNMDVVADPRGHIFVSDPIKLEVFEFEPEGGTSS